MRVEKEEFRGTPRNELIYFKSYESPKLILCQHLELSNNLSKMNLIGCQYMVLFIC